MWCSSHKRMESDTEVYPFVCPDLDRFAVGLLWADGGFHGRMDRDEGLGYAG